MRYNALQELHQQSEEEKSNHHSSAGCSEKHRPVPYVTEKLERLPEWVNAGKCAMLFCVFIVLWIFVVYAQGSDNLKKQVKIKGLKCREKGPDIYSLHCHLGR